MPQHFYSFIVSWIPPPRKACRFVTTVLLVFSLACGTGFAQTVIHPTKENIPISSDPRFELRHELDGSGSWEWDSFEVTEIGAKEGDYYQMLGMVFDLELDWRGTLYYLDLLNTEVRAYDYEGNWISNVGGSPGVGPGELNSPLGFAVAPEGKQVIVSDQLVNHVFERNDAAFKLTSTQRPKYPAQAGQLCVMNGHYFTVSSTSQEAPLIHKYTLRGEWVTSFGKPYKDDDPFIVAMFAHGAFLACNAKYRTVAIVTNHIPAMTGYSEWGEKLWQVTFPDYRSDTVKESWENERKYHSVLQEDNRSVFKSLFSDGKYFYVTYSFQFRAPSEYPPIKFSGGHAFRVDAQTGLGVYLGTAGPVSGEHLMALDGDYRFTVTENEGFPQIRIYKPRQ